MGQMTGQNRGTYGAWGDQPYRLLAATTLEFPMLDVVYLVGGTFFFIISVIYTTACDHL